MHRSAWLFFIVTGALTAFTLLVPDAVIIGLFLLIAPGLVLLATPPLFMYGLIAFVAWNLVKPLGKAASIVTAAVAIAACAVMPPLILNEPVNKLVAEVTAGDRALEAPIANVRRLALLRPRFEGWREIETETDCGELCQRLLFNGAVEEILLGTAPAFVVTPNPALTVTRYRVERRASCPAIKVPTASAWTGENVRGVAFSSVVSDRIKVRIANGECLIAEPASLADADAVVVDGKAYESAKRAWDSPWNPLLVSLRAARVSAFTPSDGRFTEIYRHTSVESEPLVIPFMASTIFGHGFSVKAGLVRWKNVQGTYELRATFRDVFKLDVSIPKDIGPETVRSSLMSALADPALPADHPRLTVADAYLIGLNDAASVSGDDVAVVRALIGDERVRRFFHLPGAVRRLGPEAAPLAAPLLDRIMASQMRADRDVIHSMSSAIRFLPAGALVPVMHRLRTLAADEQRRGASWRALSRLADGGAENTALLVTLAQATLNATTDRSDRYDQTDTPIGALIGLCLLGEQARPAVPVLLDIVKSKSRAGNLGSITELAIVALEKIGAAGDIEEAIALSDEQRRRIEWLVNNARRNTPAQACYSLYS